MLSLPGKNIYLRPLEPEDINTIYLWENDPQNWRYSNTITPFSKFYIEQYILNSSCNIHTDKQLRLLISDCQLNPVGLIDLFDFDQKNQRTAVGLLIVKQYRRKGYGSEALEIIIDYCKNVLSLHQIYCNIASGNESSLRLFKSSGFVVAGLKKQWLRYNNKWEDEFILQRILE